MALDLKEELHRLVDEIPDSRPDLARTMLGLGVLLTHDPDRANPWFQRLVRDVADLHASAENPDDLSSGLDALRARWMRGESEREYALPKSLAEAPVDDEPLTPEEIAILDARRAALASGPTYSQEEVGRMLDEVGRMLKE